MAFEFCIGRLDLLKPTPFARPKSVTTAYCCWMAAELFYNRELMCFTRTMDMNFCIGYCLMEEGPEQGSR